MAVARYRRKGGHRVVAAHTPSSGDRANAAAANRTSRRRAIVRFQPPRSHRPSHGDVRNLMTAMRVSNSRRRVRGGPLATGHNTPRGVTHKSVGKLTASVGRRARSAIRGAGRSASGFGKQKMVRAGAAKTRMGKL